MTCQKKKEVITIESIKLNEKLVDETKNSDFDKQKMTDRCYEQWTDELQQSRGKAVSFKNENQKWKLIFIFCKH